MKHRTYSDMLQCDTFEERFEYLKLSGEVGAATFGFDRWINQHFYRSREWRQARDFVIVRDNGCDLGVPGLNIAQDLLVHHINPMRPEDLSEGKQWVLDPEFLITTCQRTHNAIHYGSFDNLPKPPVERQPGDTKLW